MRLVGQYPSLGMLLLVVEARRLRKRCSALMLIRWFDQAESVMAVACSQYGLHAVEEIC